MRQRTAESIFSEILLLSDLEREKLLNRIKRGFNTNNEIVALTVTGKPMSKNDYLEQIKIGLRQVENGEMISDDELKKEIETW